MNQDNKIEIGDQEVRFFTLGDMINKIKLGDQDLRTFLLFLDL